MSLDPTSLDSDDLNLETCEKILEYRFRDRELLRRALTHSSIATSRLSSNERMEFLGDSVLGMVVCEFLFERYPDFAEGELTRIKSSVVSRSTCARISHDIDLQDCLYLGKGLTNHDAIPESVVAGSFEGVIAALYLDGGYEVAQDFLLRLLEPEITRLVEQEEEDLEMVEVQIDEFGSFLVLATDWQEETPGKQNLITTLKRAKQEGVPARLVIKVHELCKLQFLVDAMDAGTIAGYAETQVTQVEDFD